jgi:histidinol dehydrogenase
VLDFVKISSVIGLENEPAGELSAIAAELANLESLTAHASAARARMVEK